MYNNTEYGFQILYPQDWTFIEGDTKPGDYITDIVVFEPLGEQGKHYSKKVTCGEVCLAITTFSSTLGPSTLQLWSDDLYNGQKEQKSFNLLEFKTDSVNTLGNKKALELAFESKQGKREYVTKYMGFLYPDPDANESNTLFTITSKTRDKYSDQMIPLTQTMVDSFRYTKNNTQ